MSGESGMTVQPLCPMSAGSVDHNFLGHHWATKADTRSVPISMKHTFESKMERNEEFLEGSERRRTDRTVRFLHFRDDARGPSRTICNWRFVRAMVVF
jgi:hypothetical protein